MLLSDFFCQSCRVTRAGIIFPISQMRRLMIRGVSELDQKHTASTRSWLWQGRLQMPSLWHWLQSETLEVDAELQWEPVKGRPSSLRGREWWLRNIKTRKLCCKDLTFHQWVVQADALLQRNITIPGASAVPFSETDISLYEAQVSKGM